LTGPLTALTIPSTLQDALMTRLDRLGTAKSVAQLGATIGRQFPYVLLQMEAISHLTQGLEGLKRLSETPARLQQELAFHLTLGTSLIATKGYSAPEVEQTYTSARQLCQHLEDPRQLFPVLRGLGSYYNVCAEYQTARALGERLLTLAQQAQDPVLLVVAHRALVERCSSWEQ
jgi:hypothetical protein